MSTATKKAKVYLLRLFVAAVAILLPIGLASPAQASTTSGKCKVTPLIPREAGYDAGVKLVNYRVVAQCEGLRDVEIEQRVFEHDSSGRQWIASRHVTASFFFPGTVTLSWFVRLPNTEPGNEEMYQRVQFRVSSGGVTSGWTLGENSPIQSIAN